MLWISEGSGVLHVRRREMLRIGPVDTPRWTINPPVTISVLHRTSEWLSTSRRVLSLGPAMQPAADTIGKVTGRSIGWLPCFPELN